MSARRSACLLAWALATIAHGEPLPTTPVLRIDTGRHTAFIHALALDESSDRVFSASEDKTVRVWRIADGHLLDTFRIPVGLRAEGQLYALAISPDHRTLATAGWTCWDSEGGACIYLLDAATGAIRRRITGLPEVVAALRFSADGLTLAVGLMGRGGLRVVRVADGSLLAEDRDYRDKLLELDFGPQGQLIATSLDGFVRLYDLQFHLLGRTNAGFAGREPFGIRYSPDGRLIALGFNDVAKVSVLRAADLAVIQTLAAAPNSAARSITRVAWSADGAAVYGAGETAAGGGSGVLRWRLAATGAPDKLLTSAGRVGDFAVTRSGFVVFAADDPALGLIDPAGVRRYLVDSGVPDYRATAASLRVARDGSEVELSLASRPGALRRFSVVRGTLSQPTSPSPDLIGPITNAPGWRITQSSNTTDWSVNGHQLALDPYEILRAWSISPRGDQLLSGSEWTLRMLDRAGGVRWSVRTATSVRAVAVTADGRFAIAVLADGTINWHSAADGTLLLSLFLHADGVNWAIWMPAGDYASSAYGDTFVGWQINRGANEAPDFFHAVQFERELYRPERIAEQLSSVAHGASTTRALDSRAILAILPPRLTMAVAPDPAVPARLRVSVQGQSSGLAMRDVALYVNDIPVTPAQQRGLQKAQAQSFTRDFIVPQPGPDATLRVEVFNGRSLGVAERFVATAPGPATAQQQGDLYLLAVGVNRFPGLDSSLALASAANDAEQFAGALKAVGARRFRQVHVKTLSDLAGDPGDAPDRAAVLAALNFFAEARGSDTSVLFLASHGISDHAGNYYFVPRDVKRKDVDVLLDGKTLAEPSSLIGWLSFFEALRGVAGQRLLIVDTCQALNIFGHRQDYSLVKRSASSHIAFVLAARGEEESQEYAPANHGLFTYGLLQGLTAASDLDRNGIVTLTEWFGSAAATVERLRDREIGPQTPQFIAPPVLQALPILDLRRGPRQ